MRRVPSKLVISAWLVLATALCAFAAPAAAAEPANDLPADATPITLPFAATVDTAEATVDPSESLASDVCVDEANFRTFERSVWYSYASTPGDTAPINVEVLFGTTSTGIALLRVDSSATTFVDCVHEKYSFVPDGSSTYLIGIYNDSPGCVTFECDAGPEGFPAGGVKFVIERPGTPPANDALKNAVQIGTLPFSTSLDTSQATIDEFEESVSQTCQEATFPPLQRMVWYRVDVPRRNNDGVAITLTGPDIWMGYAVVFEGRGKRDVVNCEQGGGYLVDELPQPGTYYIGVFTTLDRGTINLGVSRTTPPPTYSVEIDRKGKLRRDGRVVFSGSATCVASASPSITATIGGSANQGTPPSLEPPVQTTNRRGNGDEFVMSTYAIQTIELPCNGRAKRWSLTVEPSQFDPTRPVQFSEGRISVQVQISGCDIIICGQKTIDGTLKIERS